MNCDKTLELLSAELDGKLSEAEHAELQAHLDECADCRRVYGTLRDVDAMLPETQLEPPKALHDAVMRCWNDIGTSIRWNPMRRTARRRPLRSCSTNNKDRETPRFYSEPGRFARKDLAYGGRPMVAPTFRIGVR